MPYNIIPCICAWRADWLFHFYQHDHTIIMQCDYNGVLYILLFTLAR